jgi:hypothetical protein
MNSLLLVIEAKTSKQDWYPTQFVGGGDILVRKKLEKKCEYLNKYAAKGVKFRLWEYIRK